ncbi:GntR family transcriptional regulator [Mycolicibacterium murale]|uniref:GntR family transcriptional regulator n=1 Tax=Mycolicibacterium murale TaxID=182220 RepID=A0A7I9WLX5_9MYCO|nr:GntR family transcriptional regulator [Mycolicibacterium murale]MCV7180399.1 GntR family transcriptional regulator [Mycolicibacterium murale]GFG58732.1 GntR family transcriptional regulator [Mycolicibacterium murale]
MSNSSDNAAGNEDSALNAVEVCVARLREMIADGELGAGFPLRQADLADRLGMSRTPIREAIVVLQSEGLATVERNRGASVINPTPEQLILLYDVRLMLEPAAAGLAAVKCNQSDVDRLRLVHDQMQDCAPWDFYRLNREFHLAVYTLADNPVLYEYIRSLRYRSDPYVRRLVGGGGSAAAHEDHAELLDALAAGDAAAAEANTRDHLMHTVTTVTGLLRPRDTDR